LDPTRVFSNVLVGKVKTGRRWPIRIPVRPKLV